MVVAGSDSGGGAGIQADLKAVAALGGHAMTTITALTAQNTLGVQAVHPVPLDMVKAQFQSVSQDIGVDAIKTGMLHSAALVELVADLVAGLGVPVVVDPVMVAKGGDRLLAEDAVTAVKQKLIPAASLVTPNLDEAEALLGVEVRDEKAMARAAKDLVAMGAKAALVKGGHLEDSPCDVLFDGTGLHVFKAQRIDTPHTHGTGCTLASACATLLARGWELPAAVERARLLVRRAIMGGLALGQGRGPVHALADLAPRLALGECLERVDQALNRLQAVEGLGDLAPEVRSQIGFALPGAAGPEEVIAISGRITSIDGRLRAAGPARAGASRHVAKIVLAAMNVDPQKRAAMALRFDEDLLARARSLGWKVAEFSRADEPQEVKQKEGSTLEWGTSKAIQETGGVPDIVFDRGEVGKEPVIRLIARDPEELVQGVLALAGKE
jgi:hydroxymethylpyrimidine/phosphomethylpyrimidine kinase